MHGGNQTIHFTIIQICPATVNYIVVLLQTPHTSPPCNAPRISSSIFFTYVQHPFCCMPYCSRLAPRKHAVIRFNMQKVQEQIARQVCFKKKRIIKNIQNSPKVQKQRPTLRLLHCLILFVNSSSFNEKFVLSKVREFIFLK